MLQLAQAADDSIEAINVPTRTIQRRLTLCRTRPKLRGRNVSCLYLARTLPYPRGRLSTTVASWMEYACAPSVADR
jgi:hypothetical protein